MIDSMNRTLPLLLIASAAGVAQTESPTSLEGTWLGTLSNGANAVRLVCVFERPGADTQTGSITSIAGRVTGNKIESVTVNEDRVRFEVKRIKGSYEGTLTQGAQQMDGVWIQPNMRLPLVLTRTQTTSITEPEFMGVDAWVPKSPTVVRAGGKEWLFYEVHVTNWSDSEITLLRLEVLIGDDAVAIEGEALNKVAIAAGTKLAPGLRSVILVNAAGERFPDSIRHRVTFQLAGRTLPNIVECANTPVGRGAVEIAPPVAGGPWQVGSGPDTSHHHRGAILAYQGRATISQRFAFDFFLEKELDASSGKGDPMNNRDHRSYGAPVFAVADATVASVVDGLPDNVPYDIFPVVSLNADKLYGNRVTLDLGHGRYATYGHLQAGVRVKAGDRIKAGQMLGLIGDSGASAAPHLHFQVTDGPDPIASEGIPFVFTSFRRNGSSYSGEMPLNEWSIGFPERK